MSREANVSIYDTTLSQEAKLKQLLYELDQIGVKVRRSLLPRTLTNRHTRAHAHTLDAREHRTRCYAAQTP